LEDADEAFAPKGGGFIATGNKAEAAAATIKNLIIVGDFMSLIRALVLRVGKVNQQRSVDGSFSQVRYNLRVLRPSRSPRGAQAASVAC
jgi:hypothetical protein